MAEVTRRLGVADILDLAEKRLKQYAERDAWYDRLMTYYFGRQPQGHSYNAYSGLILPSNSAGRPLLRQVGESLNTHRTYTSQRLAPVVDDFTALKGRMPTTRVDAPDPSQQGEEKAELLTKYLYSTYEMSNLESQQGQSGFWLSGLGDSVYLLEPEPDKLRVVWTVICPRNAYPSFFHGYRRFEVYDLLTIEIWNEDDIAEQLGETPRSDSPEDCAVVIYTSPYQRSVVLGSGQYAKAVKNAEWDLGFCPCAWAFNKLTGHMGMSDIGQSLGQQDFHDWSMNVWADGLVHMTYPILMIKNPIAFGQDNMTIGPGAPPVPVQADGDLKAITTAGDPHAIQAIMQQTLSDITAATGSSQVRQEGEMKGSIVTGRAVHAVQGPQSNRLEFNQDILTAVWRRLNSMTLAMQEKAPHLGAKLEIYGRYKGASFRTELDPKHDIDGWYRNTVTWESLVGMNLQQKLGVAYEGKVAGLWDTPYAMQMVGVDDPLAMVKRVEEEKKREMAMQAPPGQGGAPGAPAGGNPPGQAAPPNAAGPPPGPLVFNPPKPAQAMQAPGGGAPQQAAAPPGGQPNGAAKDAVEKALEPVKDKLKGSVYAVGDLALKGQSAQVTLAISDSRDMTKVLEAVRALDPKARVRKVPEDKLPDEAVRVA